MDEKSVIKIEANNELVEIDFHESRENLKEIIQTTDKAIAEVADLAYQSQSPRFYEALNGLLKTQIEANRDAVAIHKVRKDIHGKEPPKEHTQNNLIVTSADILNMIYQNSIKEIK